MRRPVRDAHECRRRIASSRQPPKACDASVPQRLVQMKVRGAGYLRSRGRASSAATSVREKESARNALPTLPIHGSWTACPEKDEAESIGPMGRLSRTDGEQTHYEVTSGLRLPALTMLAARDSTVSPPPRFGERHGRSAGEMYRQAFAAGRFGTGEDCLPSLQLRASSFRRELWARAWNLDGRRDGSR